MECASLNWLVTCHDNSWHVMTCHDNQHGFVTKNHQMSPNVTKYHHMSWNVTMLNWKIFDDSWWSQLHDIWWHFFQLLKRRISSWVLLSWCHQMLNHQKSFNLTWWHLVTCHNIITPIQRGSSTLLVVCVKSNSCTHLCHNFGMAHFFSEMWSVLIKLHMSFFWATPSKAAYAPFQQPMAPVYAHILTIYSYRYMF